MTNLTKAHQELYRRTPDESFLSFDDLYRHCADQRTRSTDLWEHPQDVVLTSDLTLTVGEENGHRLNEFYGLSLKTAKTPLNTTIVDSGALLSPHSKRRIALLYVPLRASIRPVFLTDQQRRQAPPDDGAGTRELPLNGVSRDRPAHYPYRCCRPSTAVQPHEYPWCACFPDWILPY